MLFYKQLTSLVNCKFENMAENWGGGGGLGLLKISIFFFSHNVSYPLTLYQTMLGYYKLNLKTLFKALCENEKIMFSKA